MAIARMAGPPEHPATPVSPDTFAQTQLTKLQTATSAVPSGATSGSTGAPVHTTVAATRRKAVRAAHAVPRRPVIVKYAVSFGDFASHATANRLVHVIGRKGYIVHVATVGGNSRVVTQPFHTRKQAARLAHALREIGLPAALTAIREF